MSEEENKVFDFECFSHSMFVNRSLLSWINWFMDQVIDYQVWWSSKWRSFSDRRNKFCHQSVPSDSTNQSLFNFTAKDVFCSVMILWFLSQLTKILWGNVGKCLLQVCCRQCDWRQVTFIMMESFFSVVFYWYVFD